MVSRLATLALLAAALRGCIAYEYEHEFWVRVDGTGRVHTTGRPELWAAFKGARLPADEEGLKQGVRQLFERSGLRVRRVTVTHRQGLPNVFIAADFEDVNKLPGTPAFPDLRLSLQRQGDQLRLDGTWQRPVGTPSPTRTEGLMAVRFHLPSKVYEHKNAVEGVERGNIVAWRQDVAEAVRGAPLSFGAVMDSRSILLSTVSVFAAAIALGLSLVAGAIYLVARKGRRRAAAA
jgi:hypothetical protein